jgi:hypothetical protein
MEEYLQQIEDGKKVLRERGINFSIFKTDLSALLVNARLLDEDDWVDFYNAYARGIGAKVFQTIKDWAKDFFQDWNKKEHRIWLRK